jgi:glycosyltransferase involved in cell wall biosynthesis
MTEATSSPRLAVVLSHPTQYYSPWFRWLRAHTPLTFRVFYLWDFGVTTRRDPKFETSFRWDVDLVSGYDHEFVPNTARDPGTHHFSGLTNPALIGRLDAWNPNAVLLFGYKWRSHLRVVAWARRRGIPLLFRGDSHFLGRGGPPLATRVLLRTLYAQFAAFLPVGAANRAYFTRLGVPERKLFFAPHTVNEALFDPNRVADQRAAAELRRDLGLSPQTRVVLFAGKLVPEKQPRELLAAFLAVAAPDTALVFVGEGAEKPTLVEIARSSAAKNVHFLPFANQSEMPSRYLLADLFVLPSRGHYETWGLAVNEAMHLGRPALVSDVVGCQRDLVTPGETGWVFRSDDATDLQVQLASALCTLAEPGAAAALRERVLRRIEGYTYAHAAAGLQRALAAVPVRA